MKNNTPQAVMIIPSYDTVEEEEEQETTGMVFCLLSAQALQEY
jgi:hypothetical protein